PAYFYPTSAGMNAWQRLMEAASKVRVVAIANVDSGPGDQLDQGYSLVIRKANERGLKVIGYISTDYASRDLDKVKNEMDRWVHFYPTIHGFFFDHQSPHAQDVNYYLELRNYARFKIKNKEALIVTNPGAICDEEYFAKDVSDVTCIFASPENVEQFNPPILRKNYSPTRFAILPYHITSAQAMRQIIRDAIVKRIGYVYISDGPRTNNNWGQLPSYWDDEVKEVSQAK